MVKNPPINIGEASNVDLITGLGKSGGEGNGNPLQYCCLENPMDRGAWWATVHGAARVGHNWAPEYTHRHTGSVTILHRAASCSSCLYMFQLFPIDLDVCGTHYLNFLLYVSPSFGPVRYE